VRENVAERGPSATVGGH